MSNARQVVDVLVNLRMDQKLSQAEVAGRRGVSQASQADLERTNNPRINTLINFADAIGARVSVKVEISNRAPVVVGLFEDPRGQSPLWKATTIVGAIREVLRWQPRDAIATLLVRTFSVLADDRGDSVAVPEEYLEDAGITQGDPDLNTLCFFYVWQLLWDATHALQDDAWTPLAGAGGRTLTELRYPGLVEILGDHPDDRRTLREVMVNASETKNQQPIFQASGFNIP